MRVVSVAALKGGCSKSTVSQCLAIEALKEGWASAIIDADPQGSVARWGQRRVDQGIDAPAVIGLGAKPIKNIIAELEAKGAALVVIDTPPTVSPILHAMLQVSTAVVLVTRPNPMDIEAVEATWAIVQRLKLPSATIITQAPPTSQRAHAMTLTKGRLAELGLTLCPFSLSYSLSYPYAQAAALTVQEREPGSRPRAEFAEVWAWLKKANIL